MPAPRERERDRDGHVHSSPRGASSPRGRGRGGRGGGNFRTGAPREHRERNANGVTSTASGEPSSTANGIAPETAVESTPADSWGAPSQDTPGDSWGTEPAPVAKDDSLESHPPPAEEPKPTYTPGASNQRKPPILSGKSWAQIAKYVHFYYLFKKNAEADVVHQDHRQDPPHHHHQKQPHLPHQNLHRNSNKSTK